MKIFFSARHSSSERGVALVVALLALLLLTAIGMGMLLMSNTETTVSSNFKDEQNAFFSARGGLEEGRDRGRTNATNTLWGNLPTNLPGTNNGILYVTNPNGAETVTPWNTAGANYPDDEICLEVPCVSGIPTGTPWYTTTAASATYAASPVLNWKWLRIMHKANRSLTGGGRITSVDGATNGNRVCWQGTSEITTALADCNSVVGGAKPVYELTALAVTPSGSRRLVQYEIAQTAFPNMPGSLVFDGPSPIFNAPNSNAMTVNGTDAHSGPHNAGCTTPVNSSSMAVGGYNGSAVTTLVSDIPNNRTGLYTGPRPATPDVQNMGGSIAPLNTVDGLAQLVNTVTSAADPNNIFPNASTSTPSFYGDVDHPQITVVNGDLSTSGISGSGILLVTGTLTMSGNPSFNGIILVVGKGQFIKNGGGSGTMNGSIFVANMYNGVPPATGSAIALGANNPPGQPYITWNGGGNATMQYDSCWTQVMTGSMPFRAIAQRELMY